jgi:DNA-binding response OmpR family regulator
MRVLLVQNEPELGATIKRTLTQEAYIVDWAHDAHEAWGYLESQSTYYTLGIFDQLLPGISGLELCRRLCDQHYPLPVLILTGKSPHEAQVKGLDVGIGDDYLVKPFAMADLSAKIRAMKTRSRLLQSQQLKSGNFTLDYRLRTVTLKNDRGENQVIPLTIQEFKLLECFLKHPNQIVTSNQIRDQLGEMSTGTITNVVATQMRLFRRKLSEYDCTNLIESLYGVGYRLKH